MGRSPEPPLAGSTPGSILIYVQFLSGHLQGLLGLRRWEIWLRALFLKLTHHQIQLLKYTIQYNHHHYFHISPPRKKSLIHQQIPTAPSPALETNDPVSVLDLVMLDISDQWNHTICGLLCPVSFPEHHFYPCCSPDHYFLPTVQEGSNLSASSCYW